MTAMPTKITLYSSYLLEAAYGSRTERLDCGRSIAKAKAERLYAQQHGATATRILGRGLAVTVEVEVVEPQRRLDLAATVGVSR